MEVLNVLGDNIGFVKLVSSMGDDLTIVNSARVSYRRESSNIDEGDKKLIRYLITNNHSSPLEHVMITLNVKVPLFIERQWTRHRTWKYFSLNEVSRRYTSSNMEFYTPVEYRLQSRDNKQMSSDSVLGKDGSSRFEARTRFLAEQSLHLYNEMIDAGVAKELARTALPQSMYVNFYATVDLHNLLWFLTLRRHPHAQWEIQRYAIAIESILKEIVPYTYTAWNDINNNSF